MNIIYIQHNSKLNPDFCYDRPDGLNEYVLILAHSKAWFHGNGNKYLLQPNEIFIYNKNDPQLFYGCEEMFLHDWFHFDMTEEDLSFFKALGISFSQPLKPQNPYVLSELIKTLATEEFVCSPHHTQLVDMLMRCFFMKLSDMLIRYENDETNSPYFLQLNALRNELYNFPYYNWTLDIISKKANMSKSWLQHNWKKIFGVSFQKDLIKSRIEYAKNLLYHTNYTIENVAILSGYSSDIHFIRQFKQVTGLTPGAYKKQFPICDAKKDRKSCQ